MIGLVVVTHGGLATEFVQVTEMIVGPQEGLLAVALAPDEAIESMKDRIGKAIQSVQSGDGVVVLTDMFGGTPSNLSLTFLEEGRVEILMGVNLPMLLKLASGRSVDEGEGAKSVVELARFALEYGRKNIQAATEILKK